MQVGLFDATDARPASGARSLLACRGVRNAPALAGRDPRRGGGAGRHLHVRDQPVLFAGGAEQGLYQAREGVGRARGELPRRAHRTQPLPLPFSFFRPPPAEYFPNVRLAACEVCSKLKAVPARPAPGCSRSLCLSPSRPALQILVAVLCAGSVRHGDAFRPRTVRVPGTAGHGTDQGRGHASSAGTTHLESPGTLITRVM